MQALDVRHFGQLIAKSMFGPSKEHIPLADVLGERGNIKIPSTTAIFNMSSAHACVSRLLGLCKAEAAGAKCYAMKSEVASRPDVEPYRNRQMRFWLKVTAEEFAMQFIILNSMKVKPFNAIRLNEAGDFRTQACVQKAEKIARILKRYGIVVYCYTSRDDLDYRKVKVLKISGSNFKKKGIVNIFEIIPTKEDLPKGYKMCPADCRICDRCQKSGMKTAVVKH